MQEVATANSNGHRLHRTGRLHKINELRRRLLHVKALKAWENLVFAEFADQMMWDSRIQRAFHRSQYINTKKKVELKRERRARIILKEMRLPNQFVCVCVKKEMKIKKM